jgi:hypothetical protein
MYWVDITNLPHVLFFEGFVKENDCLVTTRRFGMLEELLKERGVDATVLGGHGGRGPKEKLIQSARRLEKLAEFVNGQRMRAAIAKHSVELPRVAYGLGIPVFQFVDNEYAVHQNRLFLSLCAKVIVPGAVSKEMLLAQGANPLDLVGFDGVFESVQVRRFKPGGPPDGLETNRYVVIRPGPLFAAYYDAEDITQEVIRHVADLGYRAVVLPRGEETYQGAEVLRTSDGLNLMYHAAAVLGGGGTMNREAALLGTPTISFYQGEVLGVDRYLIDNGLLFHTRDAGGALKLMDRLMDKKEKLRERAAGLLDRMEDPFEVLRSELAGIVQ